MAKPKEQKTKKRSYPQDVTNRLHALSAGRCEFRGCNEFTLRHEPTQQDGNYAEKAHIYAFSDRGPRPASGDVVANINAIENLMLLCQPCHKRIDDNEDEYPVELLQEFKKEHEDRVFLITGLAPERKTKPLVFLANIGKDAVSVSDPDVFTSIFPNRYPSCKLNALDLSIIPDREDWYKTAGQDAISSHLNGFYREPPAGGRPPHVSVYALGPIPLLVQFGASLTNKVPTDFYQKHRAGDTWKWGDGEGTVEYVLTKVQEGTDVQKVAIILSLSGKIHLANTGIASDFFVYEVEVKDGDQGPNYLFLKTQSDLAKFRKLYGELVARICADHAGVTEVSLYPAIPAPVAVVCGFDLLPKVHPNLVVYDADKTKGGFNKTLIVTRQENV
jgi:hypothetical protein